MQPEFRLPRPALGLVLALSAALVFSACGGITPVSSGGSTFHGAPPPSPTVVSVNNQGQPANAPAYAYGISPDGRFVAFTSAATNLPGAAGTGIPEVYLRDTCFNVPSGCTPTTTMISVTPSGAPGNGTAPPVSLAVFGVADAAVSLGGRYVAFASSASNLTAMPYSPQPLPFPEIYVRDTCISAPAGCVPATTLISGINGAPGVATGSVAMSASGRFIADIEAESGNASLGVILHDSCNGDAPAGCVPSARDVTTADAILPFGLGLSADGNVALYQSTLSGVLAVYAATTCAVAPAGCTPAAADLSSAIQSVQSPGTSALVFFPALSGSGQQAAFTGVTAIQPPNAEVYRSPTCAGAATGCQPAPVVVSHGPNGRAASAPAMEPALDATGRHVAFVATTGNANANALPAPVGDEIYVRDTCLGGPVSCQPATKLVSANSQGQPAAGASVGPLLTQNGLAVVFSTNSPDLGAVGGNTQIVMMPTGFSSNP